MVVCSSCGGENREGARFCDTCGAPLLEAAPVREVRKTVTVLFCDVSGSTALGERIDPESLRRVMARYFETAKTIVERHGGTVEKFIGDAVMAVFGVPAVHEDDALRAVRAADELRGGLVGLNEELERSYGTRLDLRMGVTPARSSRGRRSVWPPGTPSTSPPGSSRLRNPERCSSAATPTASCATRSRSSRSHRWRRRERPIPSRPSGCWA
jgi:hypothetical protein